MMRIIAVMLLAAGTMFGQAKLTLNLDHLKAKAKEAVDVNLDGAMLQQGLGFLGQGLSQVAGQQQKETGLEGLKGIYVRVFEFENKGDYTDADVDAIRKQISGPNWVSMVEVTEKGGDRVSISTYMENGKPAGMAVLVAEPKELVVVNVVGPLDLSKLGMLHQLAPQLKQLQQQMQKPSTAPKPAVAGEKKKEEEI